MSAGPLLVAERLSKSYGAVKAVDDVSFELRAGEMMALIGPNGAGKSTCFDILGGQIAPDGGTVRMGDTPIARLEPHRLVHLGIARTFQVARIFETMTVRENIQTVLSVVGERSGARAVYTGRLRGRYRTRADEELDRVRMGELGDVPAAALAYGDRKRLELAMALAGDPKVLLMDEPTAGMGAMERGELMATIAGIVRQRGLALLFTEHDMDAVFSYADWVMVLDRGRLIAAGPPEETRRDRKVRSVYLGETQAATEGRQRT